jgi:tRNA uridine 5-carbamoylmethylation protein Kti12
MADKKQSSIEWLYERLERMIPNSALYNIDKKQYIEAAKKMHKQEIIDACVEFGNLNGVDIYDYTEYYNQTFNQ